MKNKWTPPFSLFASFLLIASLSSFVFFNEDWKTLLINRLQAFYLQQPKESVYLHTDKVQYTTGETIWFKAYLQNELDSIPLSKVLYVELVNEENKLVKRLQLAVNQFSTHGNFDLDDTIVSGNYRLLAYTNYMRNWESDVFFGKTLQIINPNQVKANPSSPLSSTIDIQFFPEGGDLVYNLPNELGFKAVDMAGKGVAIEGEVFDNQVVKSAVFKSNDLGMGSFKLNPVAGRTYKAVVKWANQAKTMNIDLPTAQSQGYVMNIEHLSNEKLRLKVYCTLPQKSFWIVAQARGSVFYTHSDSLSSSVFVEDIAKEIFPDGIVQFTLFDGQGIPHAERLVYIRLPQTLDLSIGKSKESYKPREKIELTVFAQDEQHRPVEGDFSMAVIDAEKIKDTSEEENLLSYFGITAQLKGKIENPAYYLKNTPESNKALDDLLLTQGWRRFRWKDLINNDLKPLSHNIEQGIPISGNIKNQYNDFTKEKSINLVNAKIGLYANTDIDENGNFQTNNLYFVDSAEILFSVEKEKNINVTLKERNYPSIKPYQFASTIFGIDTTLFQHSKKQKEVEKAFKVQSDVTLLKEVTVKDKKIEDDILEIKTLKLVNVDAVLKAEELTRKSAEANINIISGLAGKVAGVIVKQTPEGVPFVTIRDNEPKYFYDNMQVTVGFFNNINANSIDRVEVVKGLAGNVWAGGGPIIAVFSKIGGGGKTTPTDTFVKKTIQGYFTAKQFYTPTYEAPTEIEKLKPDLRTTIYWNPQVYTDSLGIAKVSFFAADAPTRYKVIIEGRGSNRNLGRKEMEIEVKK
jgi:hypothetical protein